MKRILSSALAVFILMFGLFMLVGGQSLKPVMIKVEDLKNFSRVTPATNGQIPVYNSTTGLWTPTTAAGTGDMLKATYDPVGGDGLIDPVAGGTGLNTSASTGLAVVTGGTWSVSMTPTITTIHVTNLILEGGANDTTIVAGTPSAAVSYTWPAADGANLQVLQTNGAGALAWATMPSLGAGTINYVAYWTGAATIGAEQYLAASRGGTGITTAALTGVPIITGGTWTVPSQITPALGGTGITTAASTGVPSIAAGTWSVATYITTAQGGTGITTAGSTGTPQVAAGTWSVLATTITDTAANTFTITKGTTDLIVSADSAVGQNLLTTSTPTFAGLTVGSSSGAVYAATGVLTIETTLAVARGGTNIASYTIGDLIYASGATTLSKLADAAVGQYLASGGVATAPAWATLNQAAVAGLTTASSPTFAGATIGSLTGMIKGSTGVLSAVNSTANYVAYWSDANTVTGEATLAVTRGGTNMALYAVGDLVYASGTTTLNRLADVATGYVLGSGGVNTAPAWINDLPTALTIGSAYVYRAGGTDIAVADGGTNLSSYAVGDILYASGATTIGKLADVALGQVLISGGVGVAPAYSANPTVSTLIIKGSGSYNTTLSAGAASASKTYVLPLTDGSNGQVMTTNGSAVLSWSSPAGGGDMLQSTYDADVDNDINPSAGGTGINTSASTGTPQVASGTWSVLGTVIADTAANTFTITRGSSDLIVSADSTIDQNLAQAASPTHAGLTLSAATATLTHSGATSLTVASTSGTVIVEAITFNAGNITAGAWQGTAVGAQYGGTGQNTSASTGVPSISAGTWSVGATLANTLGGTGQTSAGWTAYPYVTAGTWSADTTIAKVTNGIKVNGATSQYATITHDGTNTTIDTSTGALIVTKAGGTGPATFDISDGSSNYITLTSPSISADWTMTLPTSGGTANYALITNGSGTTSWAILPAAGGGTGITTAASTGVPSISTGTWSVAATLVNTLGGTAQNSSAWSGMVKTVAGTWSAYTGTQNYVAYWSDANTVGGEARLAASRGGTGIDTSASTGVLSVSSGTWSAAAQVTATQGGTGQNTSAWSGYPYVTAGTWGSDTSITKGTGGSFAMSLQDDITTGAAVFMTHSTGKQLSDASGSSQWLFINGEINQSGTAGYSGLYMLMIETATGSGTKNLLDLNTNGGQKFAVSNTGAVTAGSWTATPVTVPYGGTGAATYALNGILYGNAANAIGVTAIGAEGKVLTVGASPFVPAWSAFTIATAATAGNALIADGTNWTSANVLSAVPTGLTYTTATRALSLTANYFIPDNTWVGQASITTVGTIATGTWNALRKPIIVEFGATDTIDLTGATCCWGQVYTNTGADSSTHVDLPSAVVGMSFTIIVKAAYTVVIDPYGSETFDLGAGTLLTSEAGPLKMIAFVCTVTGTWDNAGIKGTWTLS